MQLKVYECGQEVGVCNVADEGLYWHLNCECISGGDELMGLFGAGCYLGLPEKDNNRYYLDRKIAKRSVPAFSGREKVLLLPRKQENVIYCGRNLTGYMERRNRRILRIPFCGNAVHPCMPLFCFIKYEDGFWLLDLDEAQP